LHDVKQIVRFDVIISSSAASLRKTIKEAKSKCHFDRNIPQEDISGSK